MYDESQPAPYSEPDTANGTKFHFSDIVGSQQKQLVDETPWGVRNKWRRFHGYNNGIWNWSWANKEELFAQDNNRIFDSIAGYIGLTEMQKKRGKNAFCQLHFPTHSPYYRVVDIAFSICVLVANEDYKGKGRIYDPEKKNYNFPIGADHVGNPHDPMAELVEKLDLDDPSGKIKKGLSKFQTITGLG